MIKWTRLKQGDDVYILKSRKVSLLIMILVSFVLGQSSADIDTTTGADLDKAIVVTSSYAFVNNEVARGYVRFKDGFTLPSGGTVYLDIHDPVSGDIDLNNGTLVLEGNLRLDDGARIFATGGGVINLNGYTLFLDGNLELVDDLHIYSPFVSIFRTGTIDAQNNSIIFGASELINDRTVANDHIIYRNATLVFGHEALKLPGFSGVLSNSQFSTLDNVTIVHDGSTLPGSPEFITLYAGFIYVNRKFELTSNGSTIYLLFYDADQTMQINRGSEFLVGDNVLLTYQGGDPSFITKSSTWHCRNSSIQMFTLGAPSTLVLKKGTLKIEGNVKWSTTQSPSNNSTRNLQLGDGTVLNEQDLVILPGSTFEVTRQNVIDGSTVTTTAGALIYKGYM